MPRTRRPFRQWLIRLPRVLRVAAWTLLSLALATCQVDRLTKSPSPIATLGLAPGTVRDSAAVGSVALAADSIGVTNGGQGTLSWTARPLQGASWLQLSPASGTAPARVRVLFDPAGLDTGVYRDTVVVTAENAMGSPARVPLEFAVRPCAVTPVAPDVQFIDSLTPRDCAAPHRAGSFARLYGLTARAGDSLSVMMSSAAFAGYVVLDTASGAGAPPVVATGTCPAKAGGACLSYQLLRSGGYVIEAASAGAAAQTGQFTLSVTHPRPPLAPDTLAQLAADSVTGIATGGSASDSTVVLRGTLSDPDAADTLRLQVEVRLLGTAFSGVPTGIGARVTNGHRAFVLVTPLANNTAYHWQARTLDQTGRTSAWASFGANAETNADFATSIPVPPVPPTALAQLQSDGATAIAVGGTATAASVVLRGTASDPNPTDVLRLEVEVEPVGTAFSGLATGSGAAVANGATATASIPGLSDNTSYHWQARVVDQTGRSSPWASFGGNAETATDFRVAVPATQLVFSVQPGATTAGSAIAPAVQVTAKDALGGVVTSFTGNVTIAIANNAGGGTLSGTATVAAVAGVATFPGLSIDKVGAGYTLRASSATLNVTSAAFNVTAASATHLVFTVQPSGAAAGAVIGPALQVTARDAFENTASGFTSSVTIAIGTNPGGGTLSGTVSVAATAGVATFSNLSIDKAGTGYTLTALGGSLNVTSAAFNIVAAGATQLVFSVQPGATTAGSAITPAVQVTAQDAEGNTATSFTGNVTVAIGTNAGGGTLSGTTTVAAVAGVATLSTLSINRTGTGYTLTAAASGLSGATSTPFNITPGAATSLVFTVQPTNLTAGSIVTPAVQVTARDALGNTASGFAGTVTIAIGTNPGGATLSGTTGVAALAGVATFGDLSLDKAGTGYTLTGAATGLSGATSTAFTVSAAAANHLVFTVQPSNATAGVAIAPAVQVTAEDGLGNPQTTFTGTVTVALGSNPGGGMLGGTTSVAAVNGVATFSTLTVNRVGAGYTLTAAGTGVTTAASGAFTIAPGSATQLAFTVQPSATTAGAAITPALQVTALDGQGNTATGFTGNVTVAIVTNPGGGTLAGTTTVGAVAGVATFSGLSINKTGTGYTLSGAASGLAGTTSNAFNVTAGSATQLAFTVQPSNAIAGATITPAVRVTARDAQGNTATGFTGNVTVAIGVNPGSGTLSGTKTVAAVSGVATFSGLSINKTGTGYTFTGAASGLTGTTSTTFNITPGTAAQLAFTVQPTTTTAGAAITPAVQVTARDAQGNTATAFTGNVTLTIGTNPGGGTLSGTATVAAVAGVASFPGVSINKTGTGYTLSGAATSLTGATSAGFDIAPASAAQLVFTVQPNTSVAGATMTPVQLTAQDAQGNTATGFTGAVTVAIGTNPGSGSLSGTATVVAVAGVATFSTLSIDKTGTGYTLTGTASGLSGATSNAFNITPGAATQLAFTVQPSSAIAGATLTPAVQVTARDAQGNTATGFTGNVTLAIANNAGGGALAGTATVAAIAGVATFGTLSIDKSGTGYTLAATATSLAGATSNAFTITPGAGTELVFTVQPSNTTAGAPIAPAVRLTARDAEGNTATGFTGDVTVATATNPSGGTLGGTTTVAAVAGVATFSSLTIDRSGAGYTLAAVATGLTGATSSPFNITPGAASQLVFTVQPGTTTAGSSITPAMVVTALDALGNTDTTFHASVAIAIGTNAGGGTLSGTTAVPAASGVATFSGLSINKAGSGYTLAASAGSLSGATSAAFAVTPGSATHLVFSVQPTNLTAGSVVTPAVQLTAQDAFGNTAPDFTGVVTVAIGNNAGGSTLSGTSAIAAVNGVATFGDLSLDKAGTGYTLTGTATGLGGATSATFTVSAATANHLVFTTQPTNAIAGAAISPAVQVTAEDGLGNPVTTFTGTVTVAIGNNPGGGTLGGTVSVAAQSGVATFATLSVNRVGAGYTLTAAGSGVTTASSTPFTITPGTASQLAFTVQPSNTVAGAAITPAIQVTALDAQGNTATAFSGNVTVAIVSNPGGGTLSGTTTVAAASGVATFPGLSINKSGTGYTLIAASSLSGATSAAFNITPGTATQLVVTQQPGNTIAGAAITPNFQVTARDAQGNLATAFTDVVTAAIGTNAGGGTLSGTTTVAAVGGVATFTTLSIDKIGTGYTLIGSASGPSSATSAAFNVTAGAATHLAFTGQPSTTAAGAAISPAVQVTAQDALGNIDPSFTATVSVALGSNPVGGTLSGGTSVAAVGGVATFSGLSLDKVGSGYALAASASGVTGGTSAAFSVTPAAATQLVFTVSPGTTTAGVTIAPAVQVTARDGFGNTATGFTGNVTVAIGTNPGGGTLAGTKTVAAASGIATFSTLSINKTGAGYTLTAAASGLTGATSSSFNVTPGTATQLAFTVQPSATTAGTTVTPAVQITARDAQGNTATGFTGNVTVAIGTNPGGGALLGTTTVAAVAGVATFSTLSIDKTGTGYTLTGAASGLTGATSAGFNITAGTATQLVYTVQPSNTVAGATITPAVQLTARDAQGNTATGFTGNVTVAIGTNPGGGTLSGTAIVAAVAGVASFSTLSLDKTGAGYTIAATASGLTGTTSTAFTITPGTATQLAFTVQPSTATAGATIAPAVQVTARDAQGNTATGFTGSVTVAIGANPGGGTLSGTATVSAVSGVATFSTLSINKSGSGYTLAASASGQSGATSAAFNISAGAATQLVFLVPPSTTAAGAAITPAVQLTAQDGLGNTDPTFAGSVTVAIGTNPGGATLSGTKVVAAVSGTATFSNLSLDKVGTGYTLAAAASGLSGTTSVGFNVTPGTASQLVFTAQPSNATAGATIAPAVQLTARDAFGNTATGFTGTVTIAIATNPGNGTLGGTTSIAAVAGVATFSSLSINKAGAGYTLTGAASGLTGATSTAFTITPGAASQLVYSVQPSTTTAGSAITPSIQVTAQDAQGNTATGYAGSVTVAIVTNPGGGVLTGTTTVTAAAGIATFSGLSINKSGVGYTLIAAATGLTSATSAGFTIVAGAASQLVFTTQPSNAVAGTAISPAVQVTALDALGNVAAGFTGNVTAALGSNPGGGTLSGTTTVAAVSGVATFATLNVNKTGSGYTLTAAASGVTGATSAGFNITPGAASQLAFSVQPTTTVAGAAITPAVQVTALDAQGNTATGFGGNVTVAIGTNPGGGTLSGTATAAATSGVATFSGLSINRSGTGYTLTGAATGLSTGTSSAFDITPGTATQLAFTVPPVNTTAGSAISPAVQVTARDALGNTATAFTGNVTVAIGTNPGGGTLSGTTTVAAAAGVATFSTLSINKTGVGYTLTGAASGLTGATSGGFNITAGTATQLVYTVQPSNTVAGAAITPAVQLTARDALGNTATGFTGNVTVAIGTNPGGGTLSGTATVAAVAGVAAFSALSINKTGAGYTLTGAASGLTGATSNAFNITPGTATQLAFTAQPTNTTAGATITPAVQLTARDALGNTATGFAGSVTVAIGTNPGGGTLSGTASVVAVAGVASFSTLSINKTGIAYTLTGAASGLSGATSNAFNITPGTATQLAFTVQPSNATAGAAITPAVQLTARDAQGNTATAFTGNVTVAIGTNAGGGTLSGTTTVAAVAGIASFPGLSIDKSGTGYTLTGAAGGLTGATSATFNIAAGAATQLVFTGQPTSATAGATISPAVQVTARDALGNTDPTFAGSVTLAIGTNPGGGSLSGTSSLAAVAGVATFSTLSINKTGAGYTLTAAATGPTGATSSAFTITPGAATQLAFTVQPSSATAGVAIAPAVQVTALDAQGNTATGFAGNVTVAIGTNPGSGTLSGTTTAAATAGVATFSGLSINKTGTGYTLTAAATTLTGATSAAFNVTPGAAARLVFSVQPSSATAAVAITPAIQVTAQDALGNTATGFAGTVTVAIGSNPGSGTLSGTAGVAAVAGVATFSTLSINKTGTGYTLTAAATSLTGATSTAFTITPGTASQLVFSVQPTTTVAGAGVTPAVQLTALDAQGNTATGFIGNVTVAIGTNAGGGTLSGTATVAATAGVATFAGLSINKTGTGYTLTGAATGLTGATSAAFDITPGTATQLAFTVQPSATTAGATITPAVQLTARDALGNTATGFTGNVTAAIGTNAGGGTLSGTVTVAAVAGVATFSTLSIDKAGIGYTLTAAATALTGATSAAFTIAPGAATQLVFTVQPSDAVAGAAISPAVQVTARDAQGNTATGFTGGVTVAIATNPGGGTLTGTATVAAVAGVATFSGLSINKTGAGYTLSAAGTALTGATSTAFAITPGAASQLAFTVQPSSATAGATITPAVQVTARDAQGNTATGFTGNVTAAIGTNPGGGTLSGTATVAAVAGVATFSTLSIDKAGTGYTLTGAAGGLTGATSAGFNIAAGTATQLAFTVQPANALAGVAIAPAVQVTAQDAQGNTVAAFAGAVTVAIGTNPAGGTLSGTTTATAVNGVATFANLSINKAGTGYTLTGATSGLTGATSAGFNIAPGAATQLAFTVQPSTTVAGVTITPAVQVTARDAQGNVATGFTSGVTLAIGTNPSGGTLAGTATVTAVAGVATFSNVSINKSGAGYTLTANAAGLPQTPSAAFDITAGAATRLVFSQQPTTETAGAAITPAVVVSAQDGLGNLATAFTGTVTVAIGTNPVAATLSGTLSMAAAGGIATFSNLSIDTVATGYTLTAAAAGLTGVTSSAFNITPGPASLLVFSRQPSNTVAGATITPSVRVTATDALGNTATAFAGSVTVAIGTNPGGGTLSGTTTATAAAGVASFAGLSIDKSGTGYTLTAASTGLTGGTSAAFNITPGTASALAFIVQPATAVAGAAISPAVKVAAQDSHGNTVTSYVSNVTVAIGTNAGGGTLAGTLTHAAVGGVATFADLSINKTGTGYTLTASDGGSVTAATSTAFNITAGSVSATLSTVSASPGTITASSGSSQSTITVTARDGLGNAIAGAGVVLAATGSGNTLTQPAGATASNGVATGTLSSTVAAAKTVSATIGGVAVNQTATVTVAAAAASTIAANAGNNQSATVGTAVATAPSVIVRDQFSNPVAGVSVTFAVQSGGGSVTGGAAVTNVAGVATVGGWTLGTSVGANTLTATSTGLTGSPVTFTATSTAGAASQIAVSAGNGQSATVGTAVATDPAVIVRDQFNNPVAGVAVTFAVATGGGSVSPTTAVTTDVGGIASVTSWTLGTTAGTNTLTATATGLTGSPVTFTATGTAGAPSAAQSLVAAAPGSITASSGTVKSTITVTVRDAFGNPVSGATVALAATGTGNSLTQPVGTTNGSGQIAGSLSSTKAEGKTVSATVNGTVAVVQTATVTVTSAAASHLALQAGDGQTATVGTAVATAPAVAVTDAFGNPVAGVAVSFAVTSGGGTIDPTTPVSTDGGGIATATSWTLGTTAGTNTMTATSGTLAGSPVTFTATGIPGAVTGLVFSGQPTDTKAGAVISPAVVVTAVDVYGNTVTAFNDAVSVSITPLTGTAGATLSGTTTVNAVGGIATFSDLSIDLVNLSITPYQLSAAAAALADAASQTFNITP